MSIPGSAAPFEMLSVDSVAAVAAAIGIDPSTINHNIFRNLLHNPRVAQPILGLVTQLFRGGRLDGRLRELVILRIGWSTASAYEWTEHWIVSMRIRLDPADVLGVRDWRQADYDDRDRLALTAVDEVIADGRINPDTWALVIAEFGVELALELLAVISAWRFMSTVIRTIDVELDPGSELWPPDGLAPAGF